MNKKEMIDNFGFNRKTLNNWENGIKEKRRLLYEVLKRLPSEFIIDVKKHIENEDKLKDSFLKT